MSENEKVVRELITAMDHNDAAAIRAVFDDEATQQYGDGSPKSGKEFFAWLDSDIIQRKGMVTDPKFVEEGSKVVVTGLYSSEGYSNRADFLFAVKIGKIVSWQMRY